MNITERLDHIDKLLSDGSIPSEIGGDIIAIRKQLDAYEQEMQKTPDYKKQIADLQAENTKLVEVITELKSKIANLESDDSGGFISWQS